MTRRSEWRVLALLLAAALALRLGLAFGWQCRWGERFVFGDSESYWALGRAVAEGGPYQFGPWQVFRAPGYPVALAPIFLVGGPEPSLALGRAESALLGTLAVAAVWWLGRELFGRQVGLMAAALTAVYPGAVALSSFVLSESLFCPLLVAQLALWIRAGKTPGLRRSLLWGAAAGLVAGAAGLTRPSWLLFFPLALLAAVLAGPNRGRQAAIGMAMLAGLLVAMTPWWWRNARVTGHFVPATLQVGASLYDGLNPQATGGSNMTFWPRFVEEESRRAALLPEQTAEPLEIRLDRRLRCEALDWAREHARQVARLVAAKLARLWNVWPNEPQFSSWGARIVVVFAYVPIAILGIMGAVGTTRRGWPYIVCWLPAVYVSLMHVVFVSSLRYREPAMLPGIVLAAWVMVEFIGRSASQAPRTKEGSILSSSG